MGKVRARVCKKTKPPAQMGRRSHRDSVFRRQDKGGRGAIPFRDDPKFDSVAVVIDRQEEAIGDQGGIVFITGFLIDFPPVSRFMPA